MSEFSLELQETIGVQKNESSSWVKEGDPHPGIDSGIAL